MSYIEAAILAFIEGLTEFLPISSTGHLIIASSTMGLSSEPFVKAFNIIIQFGAILAVLVLYYKRFFPIRPKFYLKLIAAFLPAAIIGLAVKSRIDALLDSTTVVACALIVGGVVLLFTDKLFAKNEGSNKPVEDLTWGQCVTIGLVQCFAFIPGVSRAAAAMIGTQVAGLNRKDAAEFSFFLAVPTISGAAVVKASTVAHSLHGDQLPVLLFGTVLSFVFALAAIRFFIGIIQRYGLKFFGIYRIILGVLVLTVFA